MTSWLTNLALFGVSFCLPLLWDYAKRMSLAIPTETGSAPVVEKF